MEERKCLYCGEPIIGRMDKKFCCDSCRNSYNYEKTHKQINVVRKINGILALYEYLHNQGRCSVPLHLRPRLCAEGEQSRPIPPGEKH